MSENNDLLASVKEALAAGNVENPVQNPVLPKVDLSTPAPDAAEPVAVEPAAKEAPVEAAAPEATKEAPPPEPPAEPNPIDLFYKSLEEKKAPVAAAATDANRFELEARQRAAQIEAEAQDKAKKLLEQMFADPLKAASMLGMDPMSYVMRGVNANEGQAEDPAKQDARIRAMFEEHMKKRDDVIAMQQKQLQEVTEAQKNYRLAQEKAFLQHSQNVFLSKMSDEKHAIVKNFWGPEKALNEAERLARSLHESAQKNGVPMVQVSDEQLLDHLESLATKELETARARFKAGEEALAKKPQATKKPLPKNGMNPALATESSKAQGGVPKDPSQMNDREFNAWMVKNLQASKK